MSKLYKTIAVIIFSLVLLPFMTACGRAEKSSSQRKEYHFSGQFDSFTVVLDEAEQPEIIKQLEKDLNYYHRLFTPYEEYPELQNLASINRQAYLEKQSLPEDINTVLQLAWEGNKSSQNAFNPALGEVVLLWRDFRDQIQEKSQGLELPSESELLAALESSKLSEIDYNPETAEIKYNHPQTLLDLGGVAKGWAVEKIAQNAIERGGEKLLISVGGNVRAIGKKANGEAWRVMIQDPFKGQKINFPKLILELEDEALVTSGLYERFFEFEGKRYAHILDPANGECQDQYISISILGKDSGLADFLATALFNLDIKRGKELVNHYGFEALWIDHEGNIEATEGFKKRLLPD